MLTFFEIAPVGFMTHVGLLTKVFEGSRRLCVFSLWIPPIKRHVRGGKHFALPLAPPASGACLGSRDDFS
ncbi:hypothetical protein [Bradyrhizobium cenepequi]|uniref:hypothetical protein n=1 Tax=Bradyrhizobium cenepequi TaxID=2821403 RepID=UPI001CE37032|nr:hypothetical protein [Bradyrhizobium cenepequi]MCA6111314.1 hypothetical protein [Bradyrhizobium cenepequi]